MIYIYQHMGLGDHILCHGIIRYYCEKHKDVTLFVKPHNYKTVSFMFRDIKNLNYILGNDEFVKEYISKNNIRDSVVIVGHGLNMTDNFILQFYQNANVPISYKNSKFFIQRNIDKEKELFNSLDINNTEYIFLHCKGSGGDYYSKILKKYLNPKYKIIQPESNDFFDWIYTIENAKEIHCINSSFMCLIDCLNIQNIPLYSHNYILNQPEIIFMYPGDNWIKLYA